MHRLTQTVGYLGWAVGLYFGSLVVWTLLKRSRPRHAKYWMKSISSLKSFKEKGKGILQLNGWYAVGFMAIVITAMTVGASRIPRFNIVVEHHVSIYRQLDNGDWVMSSDEDKSLVFRPCAEDSVNGVNVNELLREGVGYVADVARWEERGSCKSILRSDLGFWFRDEANNFEYEKVTP